MYSRGAGRPQTIVRRLAILAGVTILPVLALAFFMIVRDALQEHGRYLQQLQATTRAAAQTVDVEIRRLQAIVETLREAPKLREHDLPAFYGFAKRAISDYPGSRIVLYEPSGHIVFATNLPFEQRQSLTAISTTIQRVAETRRPVVSDLFTASATRSPSLAILVPVIENDAVPFVLGVVVPPGAVSEIFRSQPLPAGVLGVMFDRNNIIIARTQNEAEYVGKPPSASLLESLGDRNEGFDESRSLEGPAFRGAFVKSRLSGWTVALSIQESVLNALMWRTLWQFVAGAGLLTACALALALYHGRRIARPVASLAAIADAMEHGGTLPVQRLDLVEAQVVADRLHSAAESLRHAALERERTAQIRLRDRDLAVFHALSNAAEQTFSLQERLQSLMRAVEDALGFDGAGIWLLDPPRETLTLRAEHGMPAEFSDASRTMQLSEVIPDAGAAAKELSFGDVTSHPVSRIRDVLVRHGYQTSGRIPLIAEGKLVGLLGLACRSKRELPGDEIALLGAIGQQMGAFIHHADLYETTQHQLAERTAMMAEIMRRDRELAVYNAISIAAERTLDLQEGLRLAVDAALPAIGADAGSLYLLEPDGKSLTLAAGFHDASDLASVAGTMRREEGVSGLSLAKGEVVTVSSEDYPNPRLKGMLEAEGFRIVAGVPLVIEGRAIGTFVLGRRHVGEFTPDEMMLLAAVGRQLAVLIDRAQLYEAAQRELAERKQVQAHLEDANNELDAFAHSVSHDLRAPLRAIDGFSRILLEDYSEKLDSEGKRVIGVVRGSAARMAQMIDDILAFSRVGRTKLRATDVDMQAAVRVAIRDLEPATAGRRVDFELGELPPAHGDTAMLQQVWANLLGNAVKYTAPRDRAVITIGAELRDGVTVYFVRDNGVGFDMQYVDKLFGAFQRLHGSEFPGTGVGLSIVRRIITRHGGRAWAQSEVQKGATFFFSVAGKEATDDPTNAPASATRRTVVPEPATPG
ncbi:MAG: GAF domain-containing protein [Acetobacteraceae bacterium]|jgi:signal transduction histidine kinase